VPACICAPGKPCWAILEKVKDKNQGFLVGFDTEGSSLFFCFPASNAPNAPTPKLIGVPTRSEMVKSHTCSPIVLPVSSANSSEVA
jgi:hypothetical protein